MKSRTGKKISCFIPCRKNGDFIKNLNFLEIDNCKLVEHTIQIAQQSKLFNNTYLLSNDKNAFDELKKKYNFLKLVYTKSSQEPFYKVLKKLKKYEYLKNDEDICVLLPNYPFKSPQTLNIIHNIFKSTNSDMVASAKKEFFFYYSQKKRLYKSINYLENIKVKNKIEPLVRLAGGIFFFSNLKTNFTDIKKKYLYFINNHEAFGIYSLYDFITAQGLFDIDASILKKMSN